MERIDTKKFLDNRTILVKKIGEVVKLGYFPTRGHEKYTFRFVNGGQEQIKDYINCFAHAFFNFSNEELRDLFVENGEVKTELLNEFWDFGIDRNNVDESLERLISGLVRSTGLKAEKCTEVTECGKNQWKVGVYYREPRNGKSSDFHFLRWEEDSFCWSSKNGDESRVDSFYELPYIYRKDYKLIAVYMVTNEYAKNKTSQEKTL